MATEIRSVVASSGGWGVGWGDGEGWLQRGTRELLGCLFGAGAFEFWLYLGVCVCQNWCLHIKCVHLMVFPLYVNRSWLKKTPLVLVSKSWLFLRSLVIHLPRSFSCSSGPMVKPPSWDSQSSEPALFTWQFIQNFCVIMLSPFNFLMNWWVVSQLDCKCLGAGNGFISHRFL